MSAKPFIIVSVTSDLSTDQRVHRNCVALAGQGFRVLLVGRKLPSSPPVPDRPYATRRFRLWFHKGPLFYACYNIYLFTFLMSRRCDALFANDLDTLPANYLASKLKRIPLSYDSHEYYTGVPELDGRPLVKGIWKWFERNIVPETSVMITVNDSIARLYEREYGKKLVVIRNVPEGEIVSVTDQQIRQTRRELGIDDANKALVLQGSGINVHRGAEEVVEAMQYLENTTLLIIGGGDVIPVLRGLVKKMKLENKVIFLPRMPHSELMRITASCDAGLTLDKDTNLNYRFSLPNKIFDYIRAGIPVIASKLPEIEKIITSYEIGTFIESHAPTVMAVNIRDALSDKSRLNRWKKNLEIAAKELNWKNEIRNFPVIPYAKS